MHGPTLRNVGRVSAAPPGKKTVKMLMAGFVINPRPREEPGCFKVWIRSDIADPL